MRRPRVMIVGPTPPPYFGIAVNTKALLGHRRMNERFEVLHLDTSDRRDMTNVGSFDLTNVALAARHGAELVLRLVAQRPDLLYLPISPSKLGLIRDLELLLPAALRGTTLVIHQRGGQMRKQYAESNALVRGALRYVFDRTARVIVLGEHFRPDFGHLIEDERVRVVYNGVDPAPYLDWHGTRPEDGIIRVLYMGILLESKGYRLLLEAARRLRGSSPKVVFQFAGEYMTTAERRFTEAFIREHDLGDTVQMLGVVSGARKLDTLASADVFAFPTAYPYEGHPTVILEAMAAGLPIVSTRHVAIPETITEGREGFLVDAGDVTALTEAIGKLAADPALRATMGASSRQTLLDRFTLDTCANQIVSIFEDALGERR